MPPSSLPGSDGTPAGGAIPTALDHFLKLVIECIILALAVVSPWLFGSVHPTAEFFLAAGVSVVAVLAGVRTVLTGQCNWMASGFAICLALLFLLNLAQIVPVSNDVLQKFSPATAELYGQLLPLQAETLPPGTEQIPLTSAPGATISVYPAATHRESIRHLQLLLLFLAIRSTAPSLKAIQRLCLVMTCNGAVLAIFGLIQFFTAEANVIYWSYPTLGQVFGPFINRNHYACYINLIIGLALGLLLSGVAGCSLTSSKSHRNELDISWHKRLLQDSKTLWLSFAIALMVCSTAFSLSRGGLLALVAGFAACFFLVPKRSGGQVRFDIAFVVLLGAGAMIYWLGIERIGSRMATLWSTDVLREHRPRLWADSLTAAMKFPLGTGSGTFPLVEPMFRSAPADVTFAHPENELVEALLEGGLARLVLTLGLAACAYLLARRAIANPVSPAAGGLATGMLFSVVSLATHSLGDFAIHLPAVALLAIVVVAYLDALVNLSATSNVTSSPSAARAPGRPQRPRFVSLAAGLMMFVLAFVVAGENWRQLLVRRYRDFAKLPANLEDIAGVQRGLTFLAAAEELAPDNAELQLELARGHFQALEHAIKSAGPTQLNDDPPPADFGPPLAHLIAARNLCPLLMEAQLQLAADRDALERADRAMDYLERAALLAPTDPHVWYLCGLQALADDQRDVAWQKFRRSLELSDSYLPKILVQAKPPLTDEEVIAKLLPEKAVLLVDAANRVYPQTELASQRAPYFHRALEILSDRAEPLSASDWALTAQLHMALLEPEKAIAAYETAVELTPEQVAWRFELANLLKQQGRIDDARRELSIILGQQPQHAGANKLADSVAHDLAQGKK